MFVYSIYREYIRVNTPSRVESNRIPKVLDRRQRTELSCAGNGTDGAITRKVIALEVKENASRYFYTRTYEHGGADSTQTEKNVVRVR